MKLRVGALFFFFFLLVNGENVLELTDDNFSTSLDGLETVLVMFYAPWCGHCKRLKPEYSKAASLLADDSITLAKVDCTEAGKETCGKYSINGYPTLKIFRNGEVSQDYSGPRDASGIAKYMRAQVGPASFDITSMESLKKFLDSDQHTLLGLFEKDSDFKTMFLNYADKMREKYRFGHSSDNDVLKHFGERNTVLLVRPKHLHNKFESDIVTFKGEPSRDLSNFVKANFHGLVGHRTRDSMQDFENPMVVVYYNVDYVKNAKGTNYWRNRVLKVAKKHVGKLTFTISSKDDFQHEINEYGYDYVGDKPLVVARNAKNLKFRMEDEFSVENLEKFVVNLQDDKLKPYIKSEPVPESNDNPVKVAVAQNFEDVVTNNRKDTLVEFYAPWCGHCKKLTPVYEEVAEKLKDEDVELVKMDATANDIPPEFEVRGFPTLYWLPKDSKTKPVVYDSGREVDDFIKYIAKKATNELKSYDRSGKLRKTEL